MTLFYPDVSNRQWGCHQDVIRFLTPLRDQGFSGLIHKVTQGSDFVDEYYITALEWCIANKFPIIGYHYIDLSDPVGQANNWVNAKGTPNAMLDWEMGGGKLDNFWAVVQAFNRVGTNISLAYVPKWYLNSEEDGGGGSLGGLAAAGINLVSSAYPDGYQQGIAANLYAASGGDVGEGWLPYNDAYPAAWQFTSTATVSGFNVDVNAYRGADINLLFGTA